MSMVHEISHLQEIVDHLSRLAADPDMLPEASEQIINDIKGSGFNFKAKVSRQHPRCCTRCIPARLLSQYPLLHVPLSLPLVTDRYK